MDNSTVSVILDDNELSSANVQQSIGGITRIMYLVIRLYTYIYIYILPLYMQWLM